MSDKNTSTAVPRGTVASFLRLQGIRSASIPDRIRGLDELRGVAILVVMIAHGAGFLNLWPRHITAYGVQGVYLFFAISGYLITRILLEATEKGEPLSSFFVRRFLRIWPLMLAALAASALLYPPTRNAIAYNLVLMNNFAMAGGMTPAAYTDVMWSLAIEEQFYLVWPFVVVFVGRTRLPYAIGLIVFVGFAFEAGVLPSPDHYNVRDAADGAIQYFGTQGAMQYLALGCAIAVGARAMIAAVVGAAAAFAAYIAMHGFVEIRPVWFGTTIACVVATYLTVHVGPLLQFQPLAHIGRLCYGLYLIHFFVRELAAKALPPGLPGFAGYLLISYLLALASLYLFEAPILRTRKYFENSGKAQAGLVVGVIVMVIGTLAFLTQESASVGAETAAKSKSHAEKLFNCAGVFLALGRDGSRWQDDYYAFLGKLESEEGIEFSQRVEGARLAAQAWSLRSHEDMEAEAARCKTEFPAR